MPLTKRLSTVLVLVLAVAACGDDVPVPDQIEKVAASDNQSVPGGARLPQPLAVKLTLSDGTVVPRTQLRWRGGAPGVLSDSVSFSDALGIAQVEFTAPAATGTVTITAVVADKTSLTVNFTVTATTPPAITSVTPATFSGGDVVTIAGTNLSAAATAEIGGAYARVNAASATSVTAVVPVCLAPGSATVRVRVSGAYSNTLTAANTAAATVQLAVGDYASIDPAQLTGCATFPAAGVAGAEYLVAPQSVTSLPGIQGDYRLSGDSVVIAVAPAVPVAEVETTADRFHGFLRQAEREAAALPRPEVPYVAPTAAQVAAAAPKVGDKREFSVCNKLDCKQAPDFTKVKAVARYVGPHVAIYQDESVPANGFTDGDFTGFGSLFDNVLYDVDSKTFGVESDVDKNGKVLVQLTPVVNRLTPAEQCSQSVIVGFFYAIDIDPAYAEDNRANQAEVFYSVVPDASATITCTIPKDRITQIVPATFIHEFQHMISYGQHVLFRKGKPEETWLNEALSHFAEELGGRKLQEMGNNQGFSDFVIGDLFNGYQYLKDPSATFVMFSGAGTGSLAERGGSWLFVRWLTDKFGPGFPRRLLETRLVGTENITSAAGEPLSRLLSQWFLTNWVSDLPGFTAPARLRYDSWAFRTTYSALNQQQPARYDRPYPLVPAVRNAGTFAVTGVLRAGSGDYFRVVQPPSGRGFTLRLTNTAGVPIGTDVLARLNVIRIR